MEGYKLTTADLKTHGNCQWEVGIPKTTSGDGELCSQGWLHYYEHPLLAVLLNPIHAELNLATARLWRVEVDGKFKRDRGLKAGCTRMTLVTEIPLPVVTPNQQRYFALLCADHAIHVSVPLALDAVGLTAKAQHLRDLPTLTAADAAYAAEAAARAAAADADAAAYAADAAAYAARAAAADAYAAARAAAAAEVPLAELAQQACHNQTGVNKQ